MNSIVVSDNYDKSLYRRETVPAVLEKGQQDKTIRYS